MKKAQTLFLLTLLLSKHGIKSFKFTAKSFCYGSQRRHTHKQSNLKQKINFITKDSFTIFHHDHDNNNDIDNDIVNIRKNMNYPRRDRRDHTTSRRKALTNISKSILGLSVITFATINTPKQSHAACLPGDTSIDCIGVYKVPIDNNIKNMVGTPEQLAKYAPDLRYVPPIESPKNYKEAKEEILSLKDDVYGLTSLVSKGDLTSAGVEILRIVPRITVAGRAVILSLGSDEKFSMKAYRSDVAHTELLASLGSVDVMIGQSMAGQLGSITAAQIQILEELRNANESYDELVKAIPSDFSG